MRRNTPQGFDDALSFSFNENLGPVGAKPGTYLARKQIIAIYKIADRIPGTIPAIKSLPTDCSAIIPYITIGMLGGIRIPKVPAAAIHPADNLML